MRYQVDRFEIAIQDKKMVVSWVIGCGGMLGSSLYSIIEKNGSQLFRPSAKFDWKDARSFASQMETAVQMFSLCVTCGCRWEIYWAAGIGTMMSTKDDLAMEVRALSVLLAELRKSRQLNLNRGALIFISSAGAVYSGSREKIITEMTSAAAETPYGHSKLQQEGMLAEFSNGYPGLKVILARVSTVYGVGQSLGKKQGFITHVAKSVVRNNAICIYVPLDTIRDYIYCDDAAALMFFYARDERTVPGLNTRLVVSGQCTTIANILNIFKAISKKAPRVVSSIKPISSAYSRKMVMKSVYPIIGDSRIRTALVSGINKVMMAEYARYACHQDVSRNMKS